MQQVRKLIFSKTTANMSFKHHVSIMMPKVKCGNTTLGYVYEWCHRVWEKIFLQSFLLLDLKGITYSEDANWSEICIFSLL